MRSMPLLAGFAVLFALNLLSLHRAAGAPDNTRGIAILSAAVSTNGQLLDGVGAISAERSPTLPGFYSVLFNRNVEDCYFAPGLSGRVPGVFDTGSVLAGAPSNTADSLGVITYDIDGETADRAFHLIVFCPR